MIRIERRVHAWMTNVSSAWILADAGCWLPTLDPWHLTLPAQPSQPHSKPTVVPGIRHPSTKRPFSLSLLVGCPFSLAFRSGRTKDSSSQGAILGPPGHLGATGRTPLCELVLCTQQLLQALGSLQSISIPLCLNSGVSGHPSDSNLTILLPS